MAEGTAQDSALQDSALHEDAERPSGREQILRAAAQLFAERGSRAVGVDDVGAAVGERSYKMRLPSGEVVAGHETYFLVRIAAVSEINRDGWTELETEIIAEHRWWSVAELKATSETIYPVNLMTMLEQAGVTP